MGYTHYWEHGPIARTVFRDLADDARRIVDMARSAGYTVAGPMGTGEPKFDDFGISLNGSQDLWEDHETFELTPNATDFDFCKTARKPYDAVVCAILLRASLRVPGFIVKSNGDIDGDDWAEGRLLYAMTFDEPAPRIAR
jgi:hypothetical protein